MIDYSFGSIVLVPFPFTDQSTTKRRPALIVSSNLYNWQRPDVIIMAVTSQIGSASYFGDVRIESWKEAGLLKPSVIKPILTTIEKALVIRKLGRMADNDLLLIQETLKNIIGQQ